MCITGTNRSMRQAFDMRNPINDAAWHHCPHAPRQTALTYVLTVGMKLGLRHLLNGSAVVSRGRRAHA
jgi:hypothetical protein